jgi:predicted metal-dependent hydrolase
MDSKINVQYIIITRDVKYPRIEFKMQIPIIILPRTFECPNDFIYKHKDWIVEKNKSIQSINNMSRIKRLELNRNHDVLKKIIMKLVSKICAELNVSMPKISLFPFKSKWGSCNSKGTLILSTFLVYLPLYLIEFVLYHEITHISYMVHIINNS